MRCVRIADLRTKCQVLTWQELAEILPEELQRFLDHKYGIVPPGRTPTLCGLDIVTLNSYRSARPPEDLADGLYQLARAIEGDIKKLERD